MSEVISAVTEEAVRSRLIRARAALSGGNTRTEVWEASLIALATYEMAHAMRVPGCVSRHVYATSRAAISDAAENLALLMAAETCGKVTGSVVDLIQMARHIETACRVVTRT